MTNFEKYKDELIKKAILETAMAIDIHTNKVVDCPDITCEDCKFNISDNGCGMEEWLNSEYVEPEKEEVDWSKVPIDTKVLVSDDNENWDRGYFAGYDKKNEVIYAFPLGATSWTNEDMGRVEWRYVKLAEDGE